MAIAKAQAYERLYEDLDTNERLKKALTIAKRKNNEVEDTCEAKLIKSEEGLVLSENKQILQCRWEYFHRLMNEENPRCRRDRWSAGSSQ